MGVLNPAASPVLSVARIVLCSAACVIFKTHSQIRSIFNLQRGPHTGGDPES